MDPVLGSTPAKTFEDLIVWQKAHRLALLVYQMTSGFPRTERYGITSQMRQAAVSIPANIAEGFKRAGRPDKARMLNVAQGSAEELRYYCRLARDLGYDVPRGVVPDVDEVSRLLDAYRRRIVASQS